jgi:propionate CoA-transferase
MAKLLSAKAAAALIQDGAVIGASAIVLAGWPEQLAMALETRFLENGHPANVTLIHAAGVGDWKSRGAERFAHPGMIARWIGGHLGLAPGLAKMVVDGVIEGYCLPQGVIASLWRETAAHRPGLITKTGLLTFVDPRLEGGKLNSKTTKDIVKVIQFEGEEWMFYAAIKIDVAIIRGSTIDEAGNLTAEDEGALLECLPLAQAAKNNGGIVIAEAEYLTKNGTLNPKSVRVPGVLVDYIVISEPENHCQSAGTRFNPGFSGRTHEPLAGLPKMALNERLIIARRAAMELIPGCTVNLGIGLPEGVASVAASEGVADQLTLTTESGTIGGIPAGGKDFGMSYNCDAFVETMTQFDWYSGGGLDIAYLGAAQVDEAGNVNVSKFNGQFVGCGGFIDITQHAKKLVYCGTFTAGGLAIGVSDGKLSISHEGKAQKYVKTVEQVTFSGAYAAKTKQPVLFITERAVFELQDGHVVLIEVAPGLDADRDVIAHMEFVPQKSRMLKSMPLEIFQPKWGGLQKFLAAKSKTALPEAA